MTMFGNVAKCVTIARVVALMLAFGPCGPIVGAEPFAELPPIRSACEIDYPPFCIVHEDGRVDGFSVELLRAAVETMGREVTFRTGPWAEVKGWLERGEIDALPLVGRTPEREEAFEFTVPYLTMHGAIVVRQDTTGVAGLDDLRGRRVAVMRGDNAEEFLRREDRGLDIVTTPTFTDAFRELSEGRCDAVIIQRLLALRLLAESGLSTLRIVPKPVADFRQDFCFAVKAGDHAKLALLNEGLALVVADGTHRRLHAKWFASLELPSDRSIVIGGDHNYPPFEYLDEKGRPTGFTVELTRAIARETGMSVRIELGRWADVVDALQREEIDAIQGMFYSEERDRTLDFSPRYLVVHCVSIVRKGTGKPPETIEELAGRDVIAQAGDAILDALRAAGIEAPITTVDTQEEVVRAVAEGRHACGLGTRMGALHAIEKNAWTNIEVGSRPFYSGDYCYAVPKGNTALLAQFSEGLTAVKASGEYQRLYDKWLGIYEPSGPPLQTILKYAAIVVGPLLFVALLGMGWSWALRRQVAQRTAELRQHETFVRAVLDNLPVGVAVNSVDPTVEFEYMNELFPKLYRTTRDTLEIPGMFWQAVYGDGDFGKEIRDRVMADCASGDPTRMHWEDVPIQRQGEATTYITAQNTPVPGTQLMISSVYDVTERKRNTARIEHLNSVLRAIRDVNQLITHETDRDALLRQACSILIETRGYRTAWIALHDADGHFQTAAEAGIGEEFAALRADIERGNWPECCRRAMEKDSAVAVYNTDTNCVTCPLAPSHRGTAALAGALRHGGRDYGVLVVAVPTEMAADQEEQSLFIELVNDLSYALYGIEREQRRRQAEASLRQSEAMFRLLVETAPVGIVIADRDQRTMYISQRFVDLFGYTIEELPDAEAWWPLACPDEVLRRKDRAKWLAAVEAAQRTGEYVHPVEFSVTCKDGSVRQVEFRLTTTNELMFVFLTDITERRDAEDRLRQAHKMESIGRLAGGVAHDFNNLIMGVTGFAELAREKLPPEHPVQEDLKEILISAGRTASLTKQLLAFARKQIIAPAQIDLNDCVGNMLKMLRRLIGEDIDLVWIPGANLWPVKMDPGQVDQILANLSVNARDAINGVGKVMIETKNIRVDNAYCTHHADAVPGDYVLLAFGDDGSGIARDVLDNIFEPFYTTKGIGEGTGLGLSTVFGIVTQNDGFITVESEPGKGTVFRVHIPRIQSTTEDDRKEKTAGKIPGGTETILLVEDEKGVRKTTTRFLERFGYTVLAAATPDEALRLVREHAASIQLLLTDVVLPGMSGRELAGRLSDMHPGLKVLYMSGYSVNVIAHRGILDEDIEFLAKPFSREQLAQTLRRVLDGGK